MRKLYSPALFCCLILFSACIAPGPAVTPDDATLPPSQKTPTSAISTEVPSEPNNLTLWVAPAFAPDSDDLAGTLLQQRLTAFEEANPGINVDVRLKEKSGPGSLLNSLSATSIAAPAVLPDIISLDPDSLNTATLKELLVPLEGLVQAPEAPAWYDHAISASLVNGSFFAVPFASDTEVLAYRPFLFSTPPLTWSDVLNGPAPFLFPAGDPDAIFTLAQYLALDGSLFDDTGRPTLDPTILADVLTFYGSAFSSGVLPPSALRHETADETWPVLLAEGATSAVSPLSVYLAESDSRSLSAVPLPTRSDPGVGFAETWSWAIVARDPSRQELASRLIEWLSEPEFLGSWTYALGMLPATAPALAQWPEGPEVALASSLVTIVQPAPSAEVRVTFGPPLLGAVEAIIGGGATPSSAALTASQALQVEEED
ncbi:MAG: extracellular solute-binding protein [Anaerolineales bacterium]|nr:extracellular solute-binding protein [Anaerolineales bacterium]